MAIFNDVCHAARLTVVRTAWRPLPWESGLPGVVLAGQSLMRPVFQMLTAVAKPVAQPHVLRARPVVPARDMEASLDFLRGGFSCGSAADHISKRRRIDD